MTGPKTGAGSVHVDLDIMFGPDLKVKIIPQVLSIVEVPKLGNEHAHFAATCEAMLRVLRLGTPNKRSGCRAERDCRSPQDTCTNATSDTITRS